MELNRDFSEFIGCFVARDVRFLIVGGYAVAAHGHPRYTKDLDVWVRVDRENAARIVAALDDFGFGGLGLSDADFLSDDVVVQLGREAQRLRWHVAPGVRNESDQYRAPSRQVGVSRQGTVLV